MSARLYEMHINHHTKKENRKKIGGRKKEKGKEIRREGKQTK
jgi:hypothetical protein